MINLALDGSVSPVRFQHNVAKSVDAQASSPALDTVVFQVTPHIGAVYKDAPLSTLQSF